MSEKRLSLQVITITIAKEKSRRYVTLIPHEFRPTVKLSYVRQTALSAEKGNCARTRPERHRHGDRQGSNASPLRLCNANKPCAIAVLLIHQRGLIGVIFRIKLGPPLWRDSFMAPHIALQAQIVNDGIDASARA